MQQSPSGNKKFDLQSTPDLDGISSYVELKSWDNVRDGIPNGILTGLTDNYDQFVKGYLENIQSLDDLRYSFDIGKIKPLDNDYPDLPFEDRQARVVLDQWKEFFLTKASSLKNDLSDTKFMDLFGVDKEDFIMLVNASTTDVDNLSPLYRFIKIE
ncbi:MAG: hypothetical protein HRT61_23195 [Ekhidna sp.]|nr:hypothetical protein [Ekhidna sp.]